MSTAPSTSRTHYANETSSISDFGESLAEQYRSAPLVPLSDKRVHHIDRLRLLTSPGCPVWDVSYVWGSGGGQKFRVQLPVEQFPRKGLNWAIAQAFKSAGRFGKGMGALDPSVQSKVW